MTTRKNAPAANDPPSLAGGRCTLVGATALLLRGTEGEVVADARRLPQMDGYVRGKHVPLQEGRKGTLTDLPELPKEVDVETTAAYIRDVLEGRKQIPDSLALQVEHILHLADAS